MQAPNTEPFRVGFLNVALVFAHAAYGHRISIRVWVKKIHRSQACESHTAGILNMRKHKRSLRHTVVKLSRILTICWER